MQLTQSQRELLERFPYLREEDFGDGQDDEDEVTGQYSYLFFVRADTLNSLRELKAGAEVALQKVIIERNTAQREAERLRQQLKARAEGQLLERVLDALHSHALGMQTEHTSGDPGGFDLLDTDTGARFRVTVEATEGWDR